MTHPPFGAHWHTIRVRRPEMSPAQADELVRPTVEAACQALRAQGGHPRDVDARVARALVVAALAQTAAVTTSATAVIVRWQEGGALGVAFDRLWVQAQAERLPAPDATWAVDWTRAPGEPAPEVVTWMRSRPACVQALMRRFPPACLVRATVPLRCPAPGHCAILYSYTEDGQVSVLESPAGTIRYYCRAADLEPVGFRYGMTPAWVAAILDADT